MRAALDPGQICDMYLADWFVATFDSVSVAIFQSFCSAVWWPNSLDNVCGAASFQGPIFKGGCNPSQGIVPSAD
jgi:hypothetical protein